MLLTIDDDFYLDLIKEKKFITTNQVFSNEGFGYWTKDFSKALDYLKNEWKNIAFVEIKEKIFHLITNCN